MFQATSAAPGKYPWPDSWSVQALQVQRSRSSNFVPGATRGRAGQHGPSCPTLQAQEIADTTGGEALQLAHLFCPPATSAMVRPLAGSRCREGRGPQQSLSSASAGGATRFRNACSAHRTGGLDGASPECYSALRSQTPKRHAPITGRSTLGDRHAPQRRAGRPVAHRGQISGADRLRISAPLSLAAISLRQQRGDLREHLTRLWWAASPSSQLLHRLYISRCPKGRADGGHEQRLNFQRYPASWPAARAVRDDAAIFIIGHLNRADDHDQ